PPRLKRPHARAAPARRIPAAPPWLDIRGCSCGPLRVSDAGHARQFTQCSQVWPLCALGAESCCASSASRPSSLRQIRCDLLASLNQRCDRLGRLFEHGAFAAVQLNLDDALDALRADHGGHADIKVLYPVLAVAIRPATEHPLLVLPKTLPP